MGIGPFDLDKSPLLTYVSAGEVDCGFTKYPRRASTSKSGEHTTITNCRSTPSNSERGMPGPALPNSRKVPHHHPKYDTPSELVSPNVLCHVVVSTEHLHITLRSFHGLFAMEADHGREWQGALGRISGLTKSVRDGRKSHRTGFGSAFQWYVAAVAIRLCSIDDAKGLSHLPPAKTPLESAPRRVLQTPPSARSVIGPGNTATKFSPSQGLSLAHASLGYRTPTKNFAR